jgi:hypothetical protein
VPARHRARLHDGRLPEDDAHEPQVASTGGAIRASRRASATGRS